MKYKSLSKDRYILRLEKDEEIVNSILNFCTSMTIKSGYLSGIGAIQSADLALYKLESKEYSKKHLEGPFEIVKLSGFIAMLEKDIKTHLHIAISDHEMKVFGGHLDSAVVGATCEILIEKFDVELSRYADAEIGLNLLDI